MGREREERRRKKKKEESGVWACWRGGVVLRLS